MSVWSVPLMALGRKKAAWTVLRLGHPICCVVVTIRQKICKGFDQVNAAIGGSADCARSAAFDFLPRFLSPLLGEMLHFILTDTLTESCVVILSIFCFIEASEAEEVHTQTKVG